MLEDRCVTVCVWGGVGVGWGGAGWGAVGWGGAGRVPLARAASCTHTDSWRT